MVNQKLALKSGFTPCSTIKLVTSLAALSEHVVDRDTFLFTSRRVSYNLTTAIAHSNNPYFAMLGNQLGFERVTHYAQMLGLGEKAGLDIPGEQAGRVAGAAAQERRRRHDDELRRGHSHDSAGTGGAAFRHRQRRHALLPAISAHAGGSRAVHAQDRNASSTLAPNGYCRSQDGDARRGGFRHGAPRQSTPTSPFWGRPAPAPISASPATWAGSAPSTMWATTRLWWS